MPQESCQWEGLELRSFAIWCGSIRLARCLRLCCSPKQNKTWAALKSAVSSYSILCLFKVRIWREHWMINAEDSIAVVAVNPQCQGQISATLSTDRVKEKGKKGVKVQAKCRIEPSSIMHARKLYKYDSVFTVTIHFVESRMCCTCVAKDRNCDHCDAID